MTGIPVFFDQLQLEHKPLYEWAFGEKLPHPETSYRAEKILSAILESAETFTVRKPNTESPELMRWIRKTHDSKLIRMLGNSRALEKEKTFYPSVFPKRHQTKPNPDDIHQAGYFCYDSGTPLTSTTWPAAISSAACALDGAELLLCGQAQVAYALCRPPGHHASHDLFGGYCYFNNAAIAAKRLQGSGKVAILDIDFHHGNGTQAIFYRESGVFFISIHGDPKDFYPYFSGYAEEIGQDAGVGFNLNIPLPRGCDSAQYLNVIDTRVIPALQSFDPAHLIVSAGFDTHQQDPIGSFSLTTEDYGLIASRIKSLDVPTLVVQEGGYSTDDLGRNVVTFLRGFA